MKPKPIDKRTLKAYQRGEMWMQVFDEQGRQKKTSCNVIRTRPSSKRIAKLCHDMGMLDTRGPIAYRP